MESKITVEDLKERCLEVQETIVKVNEDDITLDYAWGMYNAFELVISLIDNKPPKLYCIICKQFHESKEDISKCKENRE